MSRLGNSHGGWMSEYRQKAGAITYQIETNGKIWRALYRRGRKTRVFAAFRSERRAREQIELWQTKHEKEKEMNDLGILLQGDERIPTSYEKVVDGYRYRIMVDELDWYHAEVMDGNEVIDCETFANLEDAESACENWIGERSRNLKKLGMDSLRARAENKLLKVEKAEYIEENRHKQKQMRALIDENETLKAKLASWENTGDLASEAMTAADAEIDRLQAENEHQKRQLALYHVNQMRDDMESIIAEDRRVGCEWQIDGLDLHISSAADRDSRFRRSSENDRLMTRMVNQGYEWPPVVVCDVAYFRRMANKAASND